MTDVLTAECAIRRLYALCSDAVWRRDTDAFAQCYAEDAEWKIAGMSICGRMQIAAQFDALKATWRRILMSFGAPVLTVAGGGAFGRTPFTELIRYHDRAVRTVGVYYDQFVHQGDCWRFQSRHCDFDYHGPPDVSAAFYRRPDYGPPPAMPGPAAPTTLLRE